MKIINQEKLEQYPKLIAFLEAEEEAEIREKARFLKATYDVYNFSSYLHSQKKEKFSVLYVLMEFDKPHHLAIFLENPVNQELLTDEQILIHAIFYGHIEIIKLLLIGLWTTALADTLAAPHNF